MEPFEMAWQLLKNESQDYESAANLERLVPSEETPQGPLPYEDMGEGHDYMRQGSTTDIRPSQRSKTRSQQAAKTGERQEMTMEDLEELLAYQHNPNYVPRS